MEQDNKTLIKDKRLLDILELNLLINENLTNKPHKKPNQLKILNNLISKPKFSNVATNSVEISVIKTQS